MIKHVWSVLCRRSVIDSETNNLSLYDVFEQLTVDLKFKEQDKDKLTKVTVPLEYEFVSLWYKQANSKFEGQFKVDVWTPKGEIEKTFEQVFEMAPTMKRMRTRLRINGFVAEDSGIYLFKISYKEKNNNKYTEITDIPFEVNIKKEPLSAEELSKIQTSSNK